MPKVETWLLKVHYLLLQVYTICYYKVGEEKIRVFPATPKKWEDATFHNFRTQGAFLISAKKIKGTTEFVNIKSLKGKKMLDTNRY